MKIRKWLRILHRDIGYLAAGLTIIYAISGVAVNHIDEWNPNYSIETKDLSLDSVPDSMLNEENTIAMILSIIDEKRAPDATFLPDKHILQIFIDGNTITFNNKTGIVSYQSVSNRPLLRESNYLHLNEPKKIWTYVADMFAVALFFLAISGIFIIKGKKGITGRGAYLTAIGFAIPLIFLILYFWN